MTKSYGAIVCSILIWSSYFIPLKLLLKALPPSVIAFIGALIASSTLWITIGRKTLKDLQGDRWLSLLGVGFFGSFGFNILMNHGLKQTLVINASLCIAMVPILGQIIGFLFHDEKITARKIIGCLLSLTGVVYLISHGSWVAISTLKFHPGDLLILLGTVSVTLAFHCGKRARKYHKALTITNVQTTIGAILLFPFALQEGLLHYLPQISWIFLLALFYLALIRSIIANTLYSYALKNVELSKATLFQNATPLLAASFAILFLGEILQPFHVVAAVFILMGITLALSKRSFAAGQQEIPLIKPLP